MARGRWSTGAEDSEELVTSHGISLKVVSQTKDNCRLESDAAKNPTIDQTLTGDRNASYLPHLDATVGHPLIRHVDHLQAQLLHQLEVNEGCVGSRDVWRLQDTERPSSDDKNVFLHTSSIIQSQCCVCWFHCWFSCNYFLCNGLC